jgi:hypothetical protein
MIIICGTIITACVFILLITSSIAAGSLSGLGGGVGLSSFGGPSLRKVPAWKPRVRSCEIGL